MKKKWLTMLLAASMVASMGTVAFAEEETEAERSHHRRTGRRYTL